MRALILLTMILLTGCGALPKRGLHYIKDYQPVIGVTSASEVVDNIGRPVSGIRSVSGLEFKQVLERASFRRLPDHWIVQESEYYIIHYHGAMDELGFSYRIPEKEIYYLFDAAMVLQRVVIREGHNVTG